MDNEHSDFNCSLQIAGVRLDEGLAWKAGNPDEQSGLGVRVSHPLRLQGACVAWCCVGCHTRCTCNFLRGIVRVAEVSVCNADQAGSIPASPSTQAGVSCARASIFLPRTMMRFLPLGCRPQGAATDCKSETGRFDSCTAHYDPSMWWSCSFSERNQRSILQVISCNPHCGIVVTGSALLWCPCCKGKHTRL